MSRKKLVALMLIVVIFTTMVKIPPVEASGHWLDDYEYRKSHIILNATGAGTNYQLKLTVYYGSGTDSGNSVYLDSKSQTDFDDIRFTDNDKTTLLDYWIEEKTDGDNATVWFEVRDNMTSSNVTIYLYYGKAGASSASNGEQTFLFFDDFPGSSLNGSKWGSNGAPSVAGGSVTIEGSGEYIRTLGTYAADSAMRARASLTYTTQSRLGFHDTTNPASAPLAMFQNDFPVASKYNARTYVSGDENDDIGTAYQGTRVWEVMRRDTTDVRFFIDDAQVGTTHTSEVPTGNMYFGGSVFTDGGVAVIDWILLREWILSPPQHDAWGAEEVKGVYSNELNLSGIYFENGTKAPADYATVTYANGTFIEYYLDGNTENILTNATFIRVTWPVEYGSDSGTRIMEVQTSNETRTLFVPESTFDIYTFEIRDYTARLGMGTAYLEAYRVINSTSYLIVKHSVIAADPYASMILVVGKVYTILIRFADNSTYSFGVKTMTGDISIALPILTMSFSQKAQVTYPYVTVEATRPTWTALALSYNDTRGETNWANVTVEYLNGTIVAGANYTTNAFTYSYLSAVHNVTYKIRVKFDHGEFGLLPDFVTFLAGNVTYSDTPDFGAAGSLGGIGTTDIIGFIIIGMFISTGSSRNAGAALIVAAGVAGMLYAMGFVSFNVVLIEVVIGIAFIYNLVRSSER